MESFETERPLSRRAEPSSGQSLRTASGRRPALSLKGEGVSTPSPPFKEGIEGRSSIGLPLGNLTSQLFANVYLNQMDQWIKHRLKSHYYIRYADDFVLLSRDKCRLEDAVPKIQEFLQSNLKLSLHPEKLFIRTVSSGMDFLGWVHFPRHRVLRCKTKKRMFRNIREKSTEAVAQSYLGLLSHGNAVKLQEQVRAEYWLWR